MKKRAITIVIFLLPLCILAQQQKYHYPVKRGSEAWNVLITYKEKRAVSQIPTDIIQKLTTRDLLESVLDYPLIGDVFVFNNLQTGVDKLRINFTAFNELLRRKDVAAVTISRYRQLEIDSARSLPSLYSKGEYSVKMSFLEVLLAQPEITDRLQRTEKIALLRHLVSNYERKEGFREVYGELSLGTNAWPAWRLSRQLDGNKITVQADSSLDNGVIMGIDPWKTVMTNVLKNLQ